MNSDSSTIFVFLHIGDDPNVELMVKSVRLTNLNAKIIQCSDQDTKKISGVTDVFRIQSKTENIMIFRLEAFYKLGLKKPAIYIDTDLILLSAINAYELLETDEVAYCQRSFGSNDQINISFRGMDLSEYKNKTVGEVYPIIACFTVTRSFQFWLDCYNNLLQLEEKFHKWYGDQEAMRNIINLGMYKSRGLQEAQVACLPEFFNQKSPPLGMHYKGPFRKKLMKHAFDQLFQKL